MIQKIIIKELNKRNRNKEKGEPSVNDLLKIILAQMIKEKQKPSYSDYFAHKQPAFGVEYHDEQKNKEEIGKNKEDISKIKDIIIHELQNRYKKNTLLLTNEEDKGEEKGEDKGKDEGEEVVIRTINEALEDPNKFNELEKKVPIVGLIRDRLINNEKKLLKYQEDLKNAGDEIEFIHSNKKYLEDEIIGMGKKMRDLARENDFKNKENYELKEQYENNVKEMRELEKDMHVKEKMLKSNEKIISEYNKQIDDMLNDINNYDREKKISKKELDELKDQSRELAEEIGKLKYSNKNLLRDISEKQKEFNVMKKEIENINMEKEDNMVKLNNAKLNTLKLNKRNKLDEISTAKNLKLLFKKADMSGYTKMKKSELIDLFFSDGFEIIDYEQFVKELNENDDDNKDEEDEKEEDTRRRKKPHLQDIGKETLARQASDELEKRRTRKK